MSKPIIMMSDTSDHWEVQGEPVKADGWYGRSNGVHTISIKVANFVGGIQLQGTLSIDPQENDWFSIYLDNSHTDENGVLRLPKPGENDTTGILAYTFVGNFVWLRVNLVRSYIASEPLPHQEVGSVNRILLAI